MTEDEWSVFLRQGPPAIRRPGLSQAEWDMFLKRLSCDPEVLDSPSPICGAARFCRRSPADNRLRLTGRWPPPGQWPPR